MIASLRTSRGITNAAHRWWRQSGSALSTLAAVPSSSALSLSSVGIPTQIGPTKQILLQHRSFFNSTVCLEEAVADNADGSLMPPIKVARRSGVRNVAIVAHVDHGKTTLVDELLKASQDGSGGDRLMDSGELEKERGITITSKVTRLDYRDNVVNVVDTPGHADFAGEVDRILSMVDGVCLVVDASEGPMAQTKYVLSRALAMGLKPIVLLNKVDRPDALAKMDSGETETKIHDLFVSLGASEDQMDYVTLYASARQGWASEDPLVAMALSEGETVEEVVGMENVLDTILNQIPEPDVHVHDTNTINVEDGQSNPGDFYVKDRFSMATTTVGFDQYKGRTCTGRIYSGSIRVGDRVVVLKRSAVDDDNETTEDQQQQPDSETSSVETLADLCVNRGISRTPLDASLASAGDIVTLVGVPDGIAVGDTVTSEENPVPQPVDTPPLAPPTLCVDFGSNDGPLSGQEGTQVTSSRIRARLIEETDNNVTISVTKCATDSEKTTVYGRGELQLGILIEQMRREGFEMVISPPKILTKEEGGVKTEPFEEVTVDVDSEYSGVVIDALTSDRKGLMIDMQENPADGKTRILFEVPSRGLLGFGPEIATITRGTAVVNHCYLEHREYAGTIGTTIDKGKLVATENGKASTFALASLADRGTLFVEPGQMVYGGMVIGESSRSGDLDVNAVKSKALTNMRATGKDEKLYVPPPKRWTVEELIGYMRPDEIIEVTPKSVRLRKAEMDAGVRDRLARAERKRQKALQTSK